MRKLKNVKSVRNTRNTSVIMNNENILNNRNIREIRDIISELRKHPDYIWDDIVTFEDVKFEIGIIFREKGLSPVLPEEFEDLREVVRNSSHLEYRDTTYLTFHNIEITRDEDGNIVNEEDL